MNFKKSMPFILSGLLILSIASCKKDDAQGPNLNNPGAGDGKDSVTVGNTLVIHSNLSYRRNVSYSWTFNGVAVSTDSVFNFKATTKGDYTVNLKATFAGGKVNTDYKIHVWDQYENGFYIVNEGWFGHGTGTVSFYRYDTNKYEDSLFVKANPGKNLNPTTSTLQSGVIYNNKFYLISKVGGPMVVTDEYSLKEQARIPSQGGNDWRSFVGVTPTQGLLSAQSGLYPLDLNSLQLGTKIAGLTGQIADLIKAGDYVFAMSATDGVVILKAADYSVVKKIAGAGVGFARTIDGSIWAAGGTKIFKINPATLDVETITVPFTISSSWGAWHPGSITASTTENAVFFARGGSFGGGTQIYKYVPGVSTSLTAPFATLPTGMMFYGAGVSFNSKLNQLLVTAVQSGFGNNYKVNNLYFYDPATGSIKKTVSYDGFYFPSVIVAHK